MTETIAPPATEIVPEDLIAEHFPLKRDEGEVRIEARHLFGDHWRVNIWSIDNPKQIIVSATINRSFFVTITDGKLTVKP